MQGDEPRHVDLTRLEGEPGLRADPLLERQIHEGEFSGRWFQARFRSNTPARSPVGAAIAVMTLALAACGVAAFVAAAGWLLGAAGGLTLTLAVLVLVMFVAVGLFLILWVEPTRCASLGQSGKSDERPRDLKDRGLMNR